MRDERHAERPVGRAHLPVDAHRVEEEPRHVAQAAQLNRDAITTAGASADGRRSKAGRHILTMTSLRGLVNVKDWR